MANFVRLSLENNAQCFLNISQIVAFENIALNSSEKLQSKVYTTSGEVFGVKQTIDQINSLLDDIRSSKQGQ